MSKNINTNDTDTDEEEVSTSIATMAMQIPLVFVATVAGEKFSLNVAAIPDGHRARIVNHLLGRGLHISVSNAQSTTKGTAHQKLEAARSRTKSLQDGTFVARSGGTKGPRGTAEERGWVAYFRELKHQEAGENVTTTTLRRAQETLARRAFLAKAGPVGSVERKDVETNMAKHMAERFDKWVAWMEANDHKVSAKIQIEKDKDADRARVVPIEVDYSGADF